MTDKSSVPEDRPREDVPVADGRTVAVIAGVVLLRDDGAALMQHRDDKPGLADAGKWVPPGGHCESGESLEGCARREFLEETGYQCAQLNPLVSVTIEPGEGHPTCQLTFFWSPYDGRQSVQCLEGQALQFIERHRAAPYAISAYLLEIWDRALAAMAAQT